ncbi:hypothetical protein C0991_011653 [Blastosporella zonata]|nr:hypothetical protein C0991_011653 [Blastosporella zonata]
MEEGLEARHQVTLSLLAQSSFLQPLVNRLSCFTLHRLTIYAIGGSISLASTDPFDQPLIDPAYLATEFDAFAMRESVKSVRRFLAAPAWKDYVIGPAGGLANATTDELLDDFIRRGTFTSAHPVGTAAMSARNAAFGVVDPDLLVKQVSGLRIVDASVMPFVTCGHTQAPVYIIAERAADLIKETWKI